MILQAIYFALPIYFANVAPVLARKTQFLNKPINKKLYGKNKTYRGIFFGILVAILTILVQSYLYKINFFNKISILNYYEINLILSGFLFGSGALIGDMLKSYFKRKLNIKPGKSWIPFDQLDFIIGGLLFISLVFTPPTEIIITLLILTPFLHITTNHIGYYLGIREVKY